MKTRWLNCFLITMFCVGSATVSSALAQTTYTVNATPAAGGTLEGADLHCAINDTTHCTATILAGRTVQIFATPNLGYVFDHWVSCPATQQGYPDRCLFTIDHNYDVAVAFRQVGTARITIAPVPINGNIQSDVGNIYCGQAFGGAAATACTTTVTVGTKVSFAAYGNTDTDAMSEWTGNCRGVGQTFNSFLLGLCNLTINSDVTLSGVFGPSQLSTYTVTVTPTAGGRVLGGDIDCSTSNPGACDDDYVEGRYVQLFAIPNTGYVFDHWVGCPATQEGYADRCLFTIGKDYAISAAFRPAGTVTVTISPVPVNGDIQTEDGKINCGQVFGGAAATTCTATYTTNSRISFVAYGNTSTDVMTSWTGDCNGVGNIYQSFLLGQCILVGDHNLTLSGTFAH